MYYDKKALAEHKKSTIKSLVGLIDAINDVPLDENGDSGTFSLEDGTEVRLNYKIERGVSKTTIILGSGDTKYTITEEKDV
jgi:hypothetical protein